MAGCYIADMQQFEQSVTSHTSSRPEPFCADSFRANHSKGGEPTMTLSEWFDFAKANLRKEEGQTMAEYGVVLAVITLGIIGVLVALSGGIGGALTKVKDVLA